MLHIDSENCLYSSSFNISQHNVYCVESLEREETMSQMTTKIDLQSVPILSPVWDDNYTAIAMSSSNEYVPYLSVCLQSLKENCCNNNYDIIVFERDITDKNKLILKSQIENDNFSLRFVNPEPLIKNYDLKFPSHYNLECYFRLVAPLILKKYKKIIFTDVDLIFQKDISDLYSIPLNKALGACQDLVFCAFCDTTNLRKYEYAKEELELNDPYKYFNTGVLLLNVDEFNLKNIPAILLEMANEKMYQILEQDVFNKYFKEDIAYLPDSWNAPTMNPRYENFMKNLQPRFVERYKKALENPFIIHWAGYAKPWKDADTDMAYLWWQYARRTPYYEVILQRMFANIKNKSALSKEDFACVTSYRKNILAYWRYKLLSKITFGKRKEHYTTKRYLWKEKIKKAKKIRGGV